MDFPHRNRWVNSCHQTPIHPPWGPGRKMLNWSRKKNHGGQEDRSPMGTKKELKDSIGKEETKAQLEPQRKLNFIKEEMQQKPHRGQEQHHIHP